VKEGAINQQSKTTFTGVPGGRGKILKPPSVGGDTERSKGSQMNRKVRTGKAVLTRKKEKTRNPTNR